MFEEISLTLGAIASMVGSLTIVGGALMWLYNILIGRPRERRREEEGNRRHKDMLELINKENKPLRQAIDKLNDLLEDSQKDRENLNRMAEANTKVLVGHDELFKKHDKRLDDHHERIVVLEGRDGSFYRRKKKNED